MSMELGNPYWRENEEKVFVLSEDNYEYYPKFEMIDTLTDIYLNGFYLAHIENIHCRWKYEVKEYWKLKKNELNERIHTP